MFSNDFNPSAKVAERAEEALLRLTAERDSWFDGTLSSIDTRERAISMTIQKVRAARVETPLAYLKESASLEDELANLRVMRSNILVEAAHPQRGIRQDEIVLSRRGRKFIAMHLNTFLADNIDTDDEDEIAARAEDHASLHTIQMPEVEAQNTIDAFVQAAVSSVRNREGRSVTAQQASDVDSLDDGIIFL